MKFGISTFVNDDGIRPDVLASAVEQRGFDALFVTEHSHIPASRQTPYPGGGELPGVYYRTLDPFVALTAAAGVTERLLLGTGVLLLVQRDVIQTAKQAATLDLLSGGRLVLGVGVGWNREEMSQHGTDPRTRGALLDEQIAAMKRLWTEEKAEFHGEHVDIEPSYSWPKPVQKPRPPIYIGGNSPAALRRVAGHADGWMPNAVLDRGQVVAQLAMPAEHGAGDNRVSVNAAGRDPEVLAGYAETGVERVSMFLPTRPERETLERLDRLAELTRPHG